MTEETRFNYSANHIYREGYEQGRADVIDLIDRHLWNYSQEVWEDFKRTIEQLKEEADGTIKPI